MGKNRGLVAGLALVCTGALLLGCNDHPVSYARASGAIEFIEKTAVDGATELDMLWVLDNSGSMCQEQKVLRDNFDRFIDKLAETNLDFHIAVTTTHMKDNYALEKVAIPGGLQSTPQPVPGFDQDCHNLIDASGQRIETDFQPIRDAIGAAVDCMTNPNGAAFSWTDADIRCGLYNQPSDCTITGQACGGGSGSTCQSEDLFPDQSEYRFIPKVLRSSDYTTGGSLDVDRLRADFACMSLVGTRGFGIEKGLSAAVKAVSLEMTGGPWTADASIPNVDTSAANHGFIRSNARFALIFVTDENDCSHDGTMDESSACGGDICEYYNSTGVAEADSPLVPVEDVKAQLLANLGASKNRTDIGEPEILVASIHGKSKRYTGPIYSNQQCQEMTSEGTFMNISPSCQTALGKAYSGDRYERFLRTFPEGSYYPTAAAGQDLTGWMCSGDFSPALEAIGEFISQIGTGCVTRDVMPCDGAEDTSCPPFPYSGVPGVCQPISSIDPDTGMSLPPKFYCSSGIQVRTKISNNVPDVAGALQGSGYCLEGSIATPAFPRGCVIDPVHYQWQDCPGGLQGIKLRWNNEVDALNRLSAMEIQVRYNSAED